MTTIDYRGYVITQQPTSHTALIYFVQVHPDCLFKCIAGDIKPDGTNNAVQKAKAWVDNRIYEQKQFDRYLDSLESSHP